MEQALVNLPPMPSTADKCRIGRCPIPSLQVRMPDDPPQDLPTKRRLFRAPFTEFLYNAPSYRDGRSSTTYCGAREARIAVSGA